MQTNAELVAYLRDKGILTTPRLLEAFAAIDRHDFVPIALRNEAYEDHPLSIAHGQTISQPYTVAFMLELLSPQEGDRVLDVGTGSGWTTTLLAHIVGSHGTVYGRETIPELVLQGRENLLRYNYPHATIQDADGVLGAPKDAPFDRILVSAAADSLPQELFQQLKPGGILVLPIQNVICKVIRQKDCMEMEVHPGFTFVPLIP